MGIDISGISDYSSFLQNYKVPTIPKVSLEEVREQERVVREAAVPASEPSHELTSVSLLDRKDAPLEDISITFNRQDDFGYIGKDSDIHSLDVEKAIDDMKKDRVLQQYQYFVGSSRNLYATESADGTVIQKF